MAHESAIPGSAPRAASINKERLGIYLTGVMFGVVFGTMLGTAIQRHYYLPTMAAASKQAAEDKASFTSYSETMSKATEYINSQASMIQQLREELQPCRQGVTP